MEEYQYLPLPGRDHIRLATIHPGEYNDDIVISLHATPFSENSTLDYEALSYAWGSEEDTEPIQILDRQPSHPRRHERSRRNLVLALRHLRHPQSSRIMWIDAICINQEGDDNEKGPQVAMMGEIFRLATRVIAWLGPEQNNSNHAMYLMEYLGSQVEVDFGTVSVRPVDGCRDPGLANQYATLPLGSEDLQAIYHLLSRPWYTRLWIRQEIYLANSKAIVLCGFRQVDWILFRRALFLLFQKPQLWFGQSKELRSRCIDLKGLILQITPVYLEAMRRHFAGCQCSDPSDRIYAVLALLATKEKSFIPEPDYEKSYIELYKEVALEYCQYYADVEILRSCELYKDASHPSWVPDWSTPISDPFPNESLNAGPFKSIIDTEKDGVLGVMGISKAVVETCDHIQNISKISLEARIEVIRAVLVNHDLTGEYVTGISKMEAYARTLICDLLNTASDPEDHSFPSLDGAKDTFERIMSGYQFKKDELASGSADNKFLHAVRNRVGDKRLITCTNGYIGVAPPSAEAGDEICILLGCHAPILLRPLGDDKFLLVGECFVLGLSRGEALLGSLPQNIRPVCIYDRAAGTYCDGYIDNLSGKKFYRDPRLESLQLGLDEDDEYFRSRLFKVDEATFRQRGVDLKWFRLV